MISVPMPGWADGSLRGLLLAVAILARHLGGPGRLHVLYLELAGARARWALVAKASVLISNGECPN
jgi:hypothetical protein